MEMSILTSSIKLNLIKLIVTAGSRLYVSKLLSSECTVVFILLLVLIFHPKYWAKTILFMLESAVIFLVILPIFLVLKQNGNYNFAFLLSLSINSKGSIKTTKFSSKILNSNLPLSLIFFPEISLKICILFLTNKQTSKGYLFRGAFRVLTHHHSHLLCIGASYFLVWICIVYYEWFYSCIYLRE